jgi:hypothetical protein
MTTDAKPQTPRPIGTVKIGTPLLAGLVLALCAPVAVAAALDLGDGREHSVPEQINVAGPFTKVVVKGENDSVRVIGDATVGGAIGQANLSWGEHRPEVVQQVQDGVLTLSFTCSAGLNECGGVAWSIRVPPSVTVQVGTSNAGIEISKITGGVQAQTSNGEITAVDLGSGPASLVTSNASITASFAGAPNTIAAHTSNSSITIKTDGVTKYYDQVSTSNGNQVLDNPQDHMSDRMIDATTSNGDINIH